MIASLKDRSFLVVAVFALILDLAVYFIVVPSWGEFAKALPTVEGHPEVFGLVGAVGFNMVPGIILASLVSRKSPMPKLYVTLLCISAGLCGLPLMFGRPIMFVWAHSHGYHLVGVKPSERAGSQSAYIFQRNV